MDSVTFRDSMIATISKSFVFLKTNAEEDTALARRYGIAGFPTMVITHPNGMEYDRLVGYYPPMDFVPALFDLMMNRNTLSYMLTKSAEYPDSLQLLNDIGEAYEYKSEYPQAAFYYTQVLDKDKDDSLGMASGAWMSLASLKRRDGKDEDAIKMYLDLADKFPNSDKKDDAYMAAAGVYRREGDVKKAVKMYEDFQKKFPNSEQIDDARVLIPYTYQHNDQPDKALKLYKEYLKNYPDSENSEWVQGQINSLEEDKNKEK